MKNPLPLPAAALLLLLPVSCQDLFNPASRQNGTLLIEIEGPAPAATRASAEVPDPGTFQLTVTDAAGEVLYDGPFDHCPDELSVPAGACTVSARSASFEAPAFEAPQWGDTQVVSVPAGSRVTAALSCHQLNSGIRLDIDASFTDTFPRGGLTLKGEGGSLAWAYGEKRTAYFNPGPVSLSLDDGGFVQTLFTRTLEPRQILTLRLSANAETKSRGISIQVDTSRNYLTDRLMVGGQGAADIASAYDVATARMHPGEKGVWVYGYIVGTATGTGKAAFTPPFSKNTNLILGARAATTDLAYCLSVELKSGAVRDALNLADNPGLLGRKVYIRGDLVSAYYGIPGLKAPSEYSFQ